MNTRFVLVVITTCVLAGVLLGFVFWGPSLFAGASNVGPAAAIPTVQPTVTANNPIARENALPGSYNWEILASRSATTQIQAFASATSVAPGQSIKFYVSTSVDGASYNIEIYRLGWYGGAGGRLITSLTHAKGVNQGYYDSNNRRLGCKSCTQDAATGLLETHWKDTDTLQIPNNWTTGVYLAKFVDPHGYQTYAPFDVLGSTSSTYVVVTPDTTAAAYNNWGGASLYDEDDAMKAPKSPGAGVSKVSFDKPYAQESGAGLNLIFNMQTIRYLERQGYDVSYISDVDLHVNPAQLLTHKAYLSIGHDEYWTREMRDGVEKARDQGMGMAFLGANTAYWQMRFEPDSAGVPNRTVVCYKVQKGLGITDLARDPLYGIDNTRVTTQWRDPVVGRPENALTGVMFSELTHKVTAFPWTVDPHANSPLLKGTGLDTGKTYGCALVGYEWDRIFNQPGDAPEWQAATPKGLQVISSSKVIAHEASDPNAPDGKQETSNSVYYVAPSGALVFSTGSIHWAQGLDDYRARSVLSYYKQLTTTCPNGSKAVPGMQKLMNNVMDALVVKHPSGTL